MIDYVNWIYIITKRKTIIKSVNCVYINMYPLKFWIKCTRAKKGYINIAFGKKKAVRDVK